MSMYIFSFLPEIVLSFLLLSHVFLISNHAELEIETKKTKSLPGFEYFIYLLIILSFTMYSIFLTKPISSNTGIALFLVNESTQNLKIASVLITMLILCFIYRASLIENINFKEQSFFIILVSLTVFFLISATDLLIVFLLFEIQTFCFYILASIRRNSIMSAEAGLTYFVVGAFVSGTFLIGCVLFYSILGTLNIKEIFLLKNIADINSIQLFFAVACIILALFFKIGIAPFVTVIPDVYDGSPLSSTIIFSVLPKIGSVTFLIHFFQNSVNSIESVNIIFLISGFISIVIGTIYALMQLRIKKLLLFSSVVQMAFVALAIYPNTKEGYIAAYVFLFIYLISLILLWGLYVIIYSFFNPKSKFEINTITKKSWDPMYLTTYSDISEFSSMIALTILIVFFSMAGIPPFVGFLSKIAVIFNIALTETYLAAIIFFLNSAAIFYYLRVIKITYLEKLDKFKNFDKFILNNDILRMYEFFSLLISTGILIYTFINPDFLYFISESVVCL